MTYKLLRGSRYLIPGLHQATVVHTSRDRLAVRWCMTEVPLYLGQGQESLGLGFISSRN